MAHVTTRAGSRPFSRALLACLFGAVLSSHAFALDAGRTLRQLHHTAWRAGDGAPSQISALAQTEDGYLWIGSARGLFRFDGVRFEPYQPPPGVGLPSYNIYALMATPDGGLWVSFRPSGLGFLKDGRLTVFTRPEELPRSQVYCFARDLDGRVWAGTHDGLATLEGSRWQPVGGERGFAPRRVRSLFVDRAGTLWVATDETVLFLPRGAEAFRPTGMSLAGAAPRMAQAADGRVWVTETSRARPVGVAGSDPEAAGAELRFAAQELLFDRGGSLWLTHPDGVRRVRSPERLGGGQVGPGDAAVESFGEGDGLSGDLANNLLEDREGNVWVSTAKGLDRFRHSHLVPLSLPPGHQRLTLLAGDDGEVWAGSAADRPLLRVRGAEVFVEGAVRQTSSVYRAPGGDVWWGASGGVWRRRGGRFDFFPQPAWAARDWVWEVFGSTDDGGLWVGLGDFGLVHFKGGRWTGRARPAGLPERVPSASYHDPSGRVWLGYTDDRVYVLEGGQARGFSRADGLEVGRIRVIRGRGPHLWFGGELGLALFRDGRFRTVRAAGGEPFHTVTGIVETADGSLWLNEMGGVVHVPPGEVRRAVEDAGHAVAFRRFDFLDGLRGAAQMNWTSSTAVEGGDGRLWFATDNGLVWIDPARMAKNEVPPPVSIRSISAGAESHAAPAEVEFGPGTKGVQIDYTAASLSIPERVRFRYRLEGVDAGWQEAGARRQAFYTNLGPGSYRFRVIACNDEGVWNEEGASLAFRIAPAFYQTYWFLLLCAAAAGCLGWVAYGWRLRLMTGRLDLQYRERLAERTRIAQDLHDTLLQGFFSASMQLHVADNQLPPDSPAKPHVGRVLDLMGRVIEEARDTVRGLRSGGLGPLDLGAAFSRVRQEMPLQDHTAFNASVVGRPRLLHPVIRDEVYFIGREALVNAFRHARAASVEVKVEYADHHLRVLVRDDGLGIAPEVLRSGREGHWGLSGMRERAERIGARLRVRSRAGAGTEVELSVPGHAAFVKEPAARRPGLLKRLLRARRGGGKRGGLREGETNE